MAEQFESAGREAMALQQILESTHSLQIRVFRLSLRRGLNKRAVDELAFGAKAIEDAVRDLAGLVDA